jgi:hypothetical protein
MDRLDRLMTAIIKDQHFKVLDTFRQCGADQSSTISQLLVEWKSLFSLRWYQHNYAKTGNSIRDVWQILFEFVEFPHPNVSMAASNCLGALLLTLAPFHADVLVDTFRTVVGGLPVSPNTSIAVISSFIFLSREVGPHRLNHFVEEVPVLHHFGTDLRPFIHHVPNLVGAMSSLGLDFHKALLRSLITSFGRAPNQHFVTAVVSLLGRFPERLIADLMEFAESNNLNQMLLACGGHILRRPELAGWVAPAQKMAIFALAKSLLRDGADTAPAADCEQAVAVIVALKTDAADDIRMAANEFAATIQIRSYRLHVRRLLIPLATDFDDLRPVEDDSPVDISVKLSAMAKFSPAQDPAILQICGEYLNRCDQAFLAVLELFAVRPVLVRGRNDLFIRIISTVDCSWVQQNAILKVIGAVTRLMPSGPPCAKKTLEYVLAGVLSRQSVVAETARHVLDSIIGWYSLDLFALRLLRMDYFDSKIIGALVLALNQIIDSVNTTPFRNLAPLITDCVLERPDDAFVPPALRLLAKLQLKRGPSELVDLCQKKVQQLYWSFTQKRLLPAQPTNFSALGPLLSSIMTDIVAVPGLSVDDLLAPLADCFQYLAQ